MDLSLIINKEIIEDVSNFMRYIYNTEFRFHGKGRFAIAEEILRTKFIDFCKKEKVNINSSVTFSSSIFREMFLMCNFDVSHPAEQNLFFIFNISEYEADTFELKNITNLSNIYENLNLVDIKKSVSAAIAFGFTAEMMICLRKKVRAGMLFEEHLTFVCLILRECGFKFRDTLKKHLDEIIYCLSNKVPSRKSMLRFLMLDLIDLSDNNWLKRTESKNKLDKEIILIFILSISNGPFSRNHSCPRDLIEKKFTEFVKANYLEPRNLNVSTYLYL